MAGFENYEPYGDTWLREVRRLDKPCLIKMLSIVSRERDWYRLKYETLGAIVTPYLPGSASEKGVK